MSVYIFVVDECRSYRINHPDSGLVKDLKVLITQYSAQKRQNGPISVQNQILLTSEGVLLEASQPLARYNGGTTDKPFFLYNYEVLSDISRAEPFDFSPPPHHVFSMPDQELVQERRMQFLQHLQKSCREIIDFIQYSLRYCRLQTRGLDAAEANLESFVNDMKLRSNRLEQDVVRLSSVYVQTDNCVHDVELIVDKLEVPPVLADGIEGVMLSQSMGIQGCTSMSDLAQLRSSAHQQKIKVSSTVKTIRTKASSIVGMFESIQIPDQKDIYALHARCKDLVTMLRELLQVAEASSSQGQETLRQTVELARDISNCAFQVSELRTRRTHHVLHQLTQIRSIQHSIRFTLDPRAMQEHRKDMVAFRDSIRVLRKVCHLPHSFNAFLLELTRRTSFRRRYKRIIERISEFIKIVRTHEIERRRKFLHHHGPYLPSWIPKAALQDYPHSCLAECKDFDTSLPDLGSKDVHPLVRSFYRNVEGTKYGSLLESWPHLLQDTSLSDHDLSQLMQHLQEFVAAEVVSPEASEPTSPNADMGQETIQRQDNSEGYSTSEVPRKSSEELPVISESPENRSPEPDSNREITAHNPLTTQKDQDVVTLSNDTDSEPQVHVHDMASDTIQVGQTTHFQNTQSEAFGELQDEIILLNAENFSLMERNHQLENENITLQRALVYPPLETPIMAPSEHSSLSQQHVLEVELSSARKEIERLEKQLADLQAASTQKDSAGSERNSDGDDDEIPATDMFYSVVQTEEHGGGVESQVVDEHTQTEESRYTDLSTQTEEHSLTDLSTQTMQPESTSIMTNTDHVETSAAVVQTDDSSVEEVQMVTQESQTFQPEMTLSFMSFSVGSVALFHPRRRDDSCFYVAFHRNTPRHIIPSQHAQELGLFAGPQSQPISYFLGIIQDIQQLEAQANNIYGVQEGAVYCLVTVTRFDP